MQPQPQTFIFTIIICSLLLATLLCMGLHRLSIIKYSFYYWWLLVKIYLFIILLSVNVLAGYIIVKYTENVYRGFFYEVLLIFPEYLRGFESHIMAWGIGFMLNILFYFVNYEGMFYVLDLIYHYSTDPVYYSPTDELDFILQVTVACLVILFLLILTIL